MRGVGWHRTHTLWFDHATRLGVCVRVCVRERERERDVKSSIEEHRCQTYSRLVHVVRLGVGDRPSPTRNSHSSPRSAKLSPETDSRWFPRQSLNNCDPRTGKPKPVVRLLSGGFLQVFPTRTRDKSATLRCLFVSSTGHVIPTCW